MSKIFKRFYSLVLCGVLSLALMAGCGGGGGGGSSTSDNNTGGSTYSISGKVADSSNIGISGVTVGLTGANTSSATTDSSGNFNFTGLANGSYTVTPSMTGYTFNPSSKSVTVSGADVTGQNFVGSGSSGADAYEPNDSFAAASTALNSGNAVTAQISSATDVDYYAINVTSAGIVSITMVPPTNIDYNLELCNAAYYGIASSYTGTGATETISYSAIPGTYYIKVYGNYSAFDTANSYSLTATWPSSGGGSSYFSISGTITDSSNIAISGVTVALTGTSTGSTTTDSSGNYIFSGLANGSYTVTPSKTGYAFSPTGTSVTVSGSNITAQNFVGSGTGGGGPTATGRIPDTGQTTSYTSTFGEDSDYTINPPSYTDNGDGTITDNVTGLVWQKQDDGTTRTWADAGAYCDASTLGGYSDWRLPSRIEHISIIDNGVYNPSINTAFFPGTISSYYWSSTTAVYNTSSAWSVNFYLGYSVSDSKTDSHYVRCVRGGQATPSLTDNGNGTVADSGTLLTWQQGENSAMTWEEALSYCEGLTLAAQTDWRLPNHKELLSLVDDTRYNPSINTAFFPGTISSYYWSSTTAVPGTSYAWLEHVTYGSSYYYYKTLSGYVRCVRGGQ